MSEHRSQGNAPDERPDPASSPFDRPEVMTGYPLSPEEKRHVDEVAESNDQKRESEE